MPGIDVKIPPPIHPPYFDREDVDCSIHSEAHQPGDSASTRYLYLFGETLLPVFAPGLLERQPALSAPADLAGHALLCSMNRPMDWPTWLEAADAGHIDGNSGLKETEERRGGKEWVMQDRFRGAPEN